MRSSTPYYPSPKPTTKKPSPPPSTPRRAGKGPTAAASPYRHSVGMPYVQPDNDLSYVENFLSLVARMSEPRYDGNPVFTRALEALFIMHALSIIHI